MTHAEHLQALQRQIQYLQGMLHAQAIPAADKYLSDRRVEAAVNRAVKSTTDNPADLERELRAFKFAQTGEDWRQKSMTLEQEPEKEAMDPKEAGP